MTPRQPSVPNLIVIYLTPLILPHKIFDFVGGPLIPLSFKGEGEVVFKRDFVPLDALLIK